VPGVIGQRLPARQLCIAVAQHPSVGDLADQLARLGSEQSPSARSADRELDDEVGLSGMAEHDVRLGARVERDAELHWGNLRRNGSNLAREDAHCPGA